MNRSEINETIKMLTRFQSEHSAMISDKADSNVDNVITLLNVIAAVAPDDPASPRPSNRTNGMCPCELADQAKKIGL